MLQRYSAPLKIVGLFLLLIMAGYKSQAQLKVGDNPTQINKSALLELQSTRQGFLLPRLTDTLGATGINALNPPDGIVANGMGLIQLFGERQMDQACAGPTDRQSHQ